MASHTLVPADWRQRITITVEEYGAIMGVSRATAYAAVKAREVPVIRLRRRIRVPVAAVIRQLEGSTTAGQDRQGS